MNGYASVISHSMAAGTKTAVTSPPILGQNLIDTVAQGLGFKNSQNDAESSQNSDESKGTQREHQAEAQERQSLAVKHGHEEILEPSEIAKKPAQKDLGQSSKELRIGDFDLLKTLGTGMSCPY